MQYPTGTSSTTRSSRAWPPPTSSRTLSSDEEFCAGVTFDLTGRIPSATDVTDFLTDSSSIKRDNAIDALIASPEFTDKWTLFFAIFSRTASTTCSSRVESRDATLFIFT